MLGPQTPAPPRRFRSWVRDETLTSTGGEDVETERPPVTSPHLTYGSGGRGSRDTAETKEVGEELLELLPRRTILKYGVGCPLLNLQVSPIL